MRGRAFGASFADAVDHALTAAFAELGHHGDVAVAALGSYGRRELCPGSDIDVLLVHRMRGRGAPETVRSMAERLWYPLWDAGLVTGHGARTVKESLALASEDLDALTALLGVRVVAGAPDLARELERKARELVVRRAARVLPTLADAAEIRRQRPGPVAEMLEPDLKEGAGGLRDGQALDWAGWALGDPGGCASLLERELLSAEDLERVEHGREVLLEVRVALHRVTNGRSDRLALQEQDAVAEQLGDATADDLVRRLARVARETAWITSEVWAGVRDLQARAKPRRRSDDEQLDAGVRMHDGRVHIDADTGGGVPALRALQAACAAAEHDARFDRTSLARLGATAEPSWNVWERAAFVRLLRTGERAVPVFEALDHEGVLTRLLPEWEHVRSRPQRNAYHRFTVDRHLLEAVARCAQLLDAADAPLAAGSEPDLDAVVARACRRPELLLLGALLHDLAKGKPGDHSQVGEHTAEVVMRRMGFDSEAREIVPWLVRNHLLMADVATRRDLSDASVADNVAVACAADAERLRLLYLLTIGDSRATGPAAWSPSKAALVRDLFVKAAAAIERGAATTVAADRRDALEARLGAAGAEALLARLPEQYVLAFDVDTMCAHAALLAEAPTVRCEQVAGATVVITVAAPDRAGLLGTLAGALTVAGLDVLEASLFGTTDGLALDVFRAADPYGRVTDDGGARVVATIRGALEGDVDVTERVEARRAAYAPSTTRGATRSEVRIDVRSDASLTDTVVEVHADDEVGLLYRLASAFADLALDVRVAKVVTLGGRVVDVFYVRDEHGRKLEDPRAIKALEAALAERFTG